VKVDRRFVVAALPLGPVLVLVGYLALLTSGVVVSDLMLCGLLVFPTAVLLVAAAVAAVWRRGASRWVPWRSAGRSGRWEWRRCWSEGSALSRG
jgi:hypothetical protein